MVGMSWNQEESALFSLLWEQMLVNEWALAFGADADQLTRVPIPARPYRASPPVTNLKLKSTIPYASRTIYERFFRDLPMWTLMGDEFVEEIDIHIEKVWQPALRNLILATNLDILALGRYHSSMVYLLGHDALYKRHQRDHDRLIWSRYATEKIVEKSSFQICDVPKSTKLCRVRLSKVDRLMLAWKQFLHDLGDARDAAEDLPETEQYRWWAIFRQHRTIEDLPTVFRKPIYSFIRLCAVISDNIFDDPERLSKGKNIYDKIPVSLLVMSLRMVNPAPFVSKFTEIFLWKPSKGTYSLFQRLASYFCGHHDTVRATDRISKSLSSANKEVIANIIKRYELHGRMSDEELASVLMKNGVQRVSENEVEYAYYLIRAKEKLQFIEHLGSDEITDFLLHLIQVAPHLLEEFRHFISLPDFVQTMFDCLGRGIKILERHQKPTNDPIRRNEKIIDDIEGEILIFADAFYKCLPKVADVVDTDEEPVGLVEMVNFVMCHLFQVDLPHKSNDDEVEQHSESDSAIGIDGFHDGIMNVMSSLDPKTKETIWEEVNDVVKLSQKGVNDSQWPEMKTLNKVLVPWAVSKFQDQL
jgi:hypothetical protein